MMEKQTLSEPTTAHPLHCIGCGAEIAGAEAAEDFRCRECRNLFEVDYPELLVRGSFRERTSPTLAASNAARMGHPDSILTPLKPTQGFHPSEHKSLAGDPGGLNGPPTAGVEGWKELWRGRRLSRAPMDRSGVWRFRELLPFMADERNRGALGGGETPLYRFGP